MKKIFTSFIMLLLCAVSMNAQYKPLDSVEPQVGENYLITTVSDGTSYYMTYKGAMQAFAEDASFLWQLEDAGDGNYYIKSGDTGKYIQEYDQNVLSQDQGGYPFDGYDIFGYAGFNFEMGDKATAMKVTLLGENGAYTVRRTQDVPAMKGYGYDIFDMAIQSNGGVNVAMEPWKSNCTWGFYTFSDKDVFEILADLAEQCDYYQFVAGDTFGYYQADKVAAFEAALQAAHEADDPSLSEADAQQIYDNLVAALDAVQKAFIRIPAGYYRVLAGMPAFVQNQGEDAVKGMYVAGTAGMWKNLDATDATFLWQVTPQDDDDETYLMVNCASGLHYSTVGQSANITLTEGDDTKTIIEIAGYDDEGVVMFNIRPATSSRGGYGYVHCGGHGGGSGTAGNLVGWVPTMEAGVANASEWVLVAVPAEEVEALLNDQAEKDKQDALNKALADKLAEAQTAYINTGEFTQGSPAITDASQFSSPFSQNDLGSADGGELADGVLIDNDPDTYWHSYWGGGSLPGNSHYLQVELAQPIDMAELSVVRRKATDDHVSQSDVWGSNDGENWTFITSLTLENALNGLSYTTKPFAIGNYTSLRFYATDTYYSGGTGTRGYFHYAEFQLYPVTLNEGCQLDLIKDAPETKALLAAIAAAKEVENATQADIDALQKALDGFRSIAADPTELKDLLSVAGAYAENAVEGTNPGCVDGDALAALQGQVDKARELLSGRYTTAQLSEMVASLQSAYEACPVNKVVAGKWYNIRYVDGDVTKYVYTGAPGEDGFGSGKLGEYDPDSQYAQWRFLDMGNGAYALQNRGLGTTIGAGGSWQYMGATRYSDHCMYVPEYIGAGKTELKIGNWAGNYIGYMEQYNGTDVTCHDGGRSSFFIEEATADDDEDILTTAFNFSNKNRFRVFALPTGLKNIAGDAQSFRVNGVYEDEEGLKLALNTVNFEDGDVIAPGEPVLVALGDITAEMDTTTAAAIALQFGDGCAREGIETEGGLVGVIGTADVNVSGEHLRIDGETGRFVYEATGSKVSNFQGYVALKKIVEEGDGELIITIPGAPEGVLTGINDALENVCKSGVVYNAAGQVVAKSGSLADVKKYGKGLYIINGVKVLVK